MRGEVTPPTSALAGALHVAFALLCLRYLHAIGVEIGSLLGPLGLLSVAAAGLGAW